MQKQLKKMLKKEKIAYYMQLIIDNLMLVLIKKIDQSNQIKIQFVLIKISIADFKFMNLPAANQLAIAESTSQFISTTAVITTITRNVEKQSKTTAKTA